MLHRAEPCVGPWPLMCSHGRGLGRAACNASSHSVLDAWVAPPLAARLEIIRKQREEAAKKREEERLGGQAEHAPRGAAHATASMWWMCHPVQCHYQCMFKNARCGSILSFLLALSQCLLCSCFCVPLRGPSCCSLLCWAACSKRRQEEGCAQMRDPVLEAPRPSVPFCN